MDLRRIIGLARVWLPLMVLVAVLCGVAAFVVSNLQHKVYEARATLVVGQALSTVNPDYSQLLVAQNLSATYATLATTSPVLQKTIDDLGLDVTTGALEGQVRVEALPERPVLTITASDTVPAGAAAIANSLAEQLIDASPTIQGREAEFQRSIDADLAATQQLIDATQSRVDALIATEERTPQQETELVALEGRLAGLRETYATLLSFSSGSATNLLTVIEPAAAPSSPVSPRPAINAALAALVGLLTVAGIAFLAEQLDESIKDADAVREVTGLSTLGTISRTQATIGGKESQQLPGLHQPQSSQAEAYRKLRSNIEFSSVDEPLQTILVTSAAPGEGKTVTAANLAVIVAQAGRQVLLVDADLRKPGVHTMFNLPNAGGLTALLRNHQVALDKVTYATDEPNLRVLTSGPLPPNPAELLGSQRMRTVVGLFKQKDYLVVFDSPPIDLFTDAAVLSSYADGTLLVVDATRSRRRVVQRARETLARAGANTLGAVLNRVSVGSTSIYGDYRGFLGHHAARSTSQAPMNEGTHERSAG